MHNFGFQVSESVPDVSVPFIYYPAFVQEAADREQISSFIGLGVFQHHIEQLPDCPSVEVFQDIYLFLAGVRWNAYDSLLVKDAWKAMPHELYKASQFAFLQTY